jgi:hypothetical protein
MGHFSKVEVRKGRGRKRIKRSEETTGLHDNFDIGLTGF